MKTARVKPEIKKFNLRIPMDLMEEAQVEADAKGISLNAYCLLAIDNFIRYTRRGRAQPAEPVRAIASTTQRATTHTEKVGRNDPCPCGSGKKAKFCHSEMC